MMTWMTEQQKTIFFWSLIAGNILGAIGGFVWWYGPQLLATPWYLWIFTPDCPLYALLFGIIFSWMLVTKKHGGLFSFLVAVGLLKYGLWTVASQAFVFFTARDYVVSNYGLVVMVWLVVSHLIMFFESPLLLHRTRNVSLSWVGAVLAWFLLNDYIDYVGIEGFTTITTALTGGMAFYIAIALIATLAFPFLAWWYYRRMEQTI